MTPQILSVFSSIAAAPTPNIPGDQTADNASKFESMLNDAMSSKTVPQETPASDRSINKETTPSNSLAVQSVEKNIPSDNPNFVPPTHISSELAKFDLIGTQVFSDSSPQGQTKINNPNELTTKENLANSALTAAKTLEDVSTNPALLKDGNSSNTANLVDSVLTTAKTLGGVSTNPALLKDGNSEKEILKSSTNTIILGKESATHAQITKNNELTTKDSLLEPVEFNQSKIGSSKEKSIKEETNNSDINTEILLALMSGQQNSQRQISTPQASETSSIPQDKNRVLEGKLGDQLSHHDLRFNALNIEKTASVSKDTEKTTVDQFIDSAKIQNLLNSGNNSEVSNRLMQIQSKIESHQQNNFESEVKNSTLSVLSQNSLANQSDASSKSFDFLNKDEKTLFQDEQNKVLGVSANSSPIHFNEHLSKNTAELNVKESNSNNSSLPTPFTSPNWGPALNQRVTWMVRDQLQNATLTINPPHLGQIEVRLQTDQTQQTSVYFMSNNPEVRQAISENLSTLRQMMSQSGLQLGQADVGSRDPSSSKQYDSNPNKKGSRTIFSTPSVNSTESSQRIGLINTFA